MIRTNIKDLKPGDHLEGNIVVLHVEPQLDGGYTLHTGALGPLPVGFARLTRKYKRPDASLLVVPPGDPLAEVLAIRRVAFDQAATEIRTRLREVYPHLVAFETKHTAEAIINLIKGMK